jgi:predicted lipoprotein with Yx(FWY)xxD motif
MTRRQHRDFDPWLGLLRYGREEIANRRRPHVQLANNRRLFYCKHQEAHMNRTRITIAAATLAAIAGGTGTAAVQTASAASARPASAAVLKVASVKVAIGTSNKTHSLLVNSKGLPVYLLTGDSKTHPECASTSCLTYWPAVTTTSSKPTLGPGIKGKVGVWKHNKIDQVTLNGHPLYTYAQDSKGSALGQGVKSFGGVWEVMGASGSAMA